MTQEQLRKKKRRLEQERQQRILVVVVIAVAALVLAAVLIVPALLSPSSAQTGADAYPLANGSALGSPDAKVLVQEFADFQCPYCRQFAADIGPRIAQDYVAAGQSVRYEYHHFIVIDGNVGGTESRRSAEASECAREQELFWPYYTLLYANQQGEGTGAFRDDRLKTFAQTLEPKGLDTAQFNQCFDTSRSEQNVKDDEQLALRLGARGTPFLVVNGAPVQNPLDYGLVQQLIDEALAR